MTLPSAISPGKKHAAKNRTIRRRRRKRTTLTDAVRRVFCYQQKNHGRFAVFAIGRGLSICRTDGKRYQGLLTLYPDNLIGIYDKTLRIDALIDDLQCFFSHRE